MLARYVRTAIVSTRQATRRRRLLASSRRALTGIFVGSIALDFIPMGDEDRYRYQDPIVWVLLFLVAGEVDGDIVQGVRTVCTVQ